MVGTTLKLRVDENAAEKYNQVQVKKLTVPPNEVTTKRAALGDLQNRGVTRAANTGKDVAQKELKDVKLPNILPNVLRNTKARVDTHWRKQPLGISNSSNTSAGTKTTATNGPLLRSNSVRTNAGANAFPRQASANALQPARTAVNTKVVADVKPVTKQKSSSDEQVNVVASSSTTTTTLRREDSNLSRQSLSKLRAALAKTGSQAKQTVGATAKVVGSAASVVAEKEPVPLKKEDNALARLPQLRAVSAPTTVSLSTKRLVGIEDIDADDAENLVLVSEYVNDIYEYLYQVETQQIIPKDHLADQLEVSTTMRAVLVDWINEVHMQFHLAAETFQLAVAIVDRYLSAVNDTKRSCLQLVGVTALFIATKYEELFPPAIGDFVYITDDTYTSRQIRMMELQIFKAIECNLSRPLPIHFLRRYSKAANADDAHHAMAKYLLELATMDYKLASYKPSEIAAASLFLSLHLINGNAKVASGFNDKHWTPTLVHYSRYTAAHLRPITKQIAKMARDAPRAKLRAVYSKYQSNKFQKIAMRSELYGALMDSIVGSSGSKK